MEKVKGLEKLKKAELIDIILRKDDVERAKNAQLDEFGTKLSASEQLIAELKTSTAKFKKSTDDAKHRNNELLSNIAMLKKTRDELIGRLNDYEKQIADLKDKAKTGKVYGIIGCIMFILAIVAVIIF